ncbi:MAG TPA: hypothetical protein VJ763_05715 [Sphingomicrobium sp.]|nr:hypothetical protein [Sphingomicrobium sp.]
MLKQVQHDGKMWVFGLLVLAGCTTAPRQVPSQAPAVAGPVEVQILAINDFHGHLEPPRQAIDAPVTTAEEKVRVPAGGAAYLAGALKARRRSHPHSVTVSAGDMIGATPLVSSLFLDEPTIAAMKCPSSAASRTGRQGPSAAAARRSCAACGCGGRRPRA